MIKISDTIKLKYSKNKPKRNKRKHNHTLKTIKVSRHEKKKTPEYVSFYYNNPNFCINCGKIIPLGKKNKYSEYKKDYFCSETCKSGYMLKTGIELTRRSAIKCFFDSLSALVSGDLELFDFHFNKLGAMMLRYARELDDFEEEEKKRNYL